MNDDFTKRVRAAAVAGWWTLLIGVGFLTAVWLMFSWQLSARPMLPWMGGVSWDELRPIGLWVVSVFKLCLWLLFLGVIWLSLWARRLKKS